MDMLNQPVNANLPKVTIVTPSLNQAKYLEATISSVLNQDYPNIEYIIIDGGSTDGSVDIIKKFQDKLAYWVSEPDGGQSSAINKGFKHAKGEIFNWLNSDDLLMPSAVKIAVYYLMNNPDIGMVYGDRITIDEKGNFLALAEAASFNPKLMMYNLKIPQETVFFRRKYWLEVNGVDEELRYCMDYDLWVKFNKVTQIYHIPFVLGAYRNHPYSKSIKYFHHRRSPGRGEVTKVIFRHYSKKRKRLIKKFYKKYESLRLSFQKKSKSRENEIANILRCIQVSTSNKLRKT